MPFISTELLPQPLKASSYGSYHRTTWSHPEQEMPDPKQSPPNFNSGLLSELTHLTVQRMQLTQLNLAQPSHGTYPMHI